MFKVKKERLLVVGLLFVLVGIVGSVFMQGSGFSLPGVGIGSGEVLVVGQGAMFKVSAGELEETSTHYEFDSCLVSTNRGETWEQFNGKMVLNKQEYEIR